MCYVRSDITLHRVLKIDHTVIFLKRVQKTTGAYCISLFHNAYIKNIKIESICLYRSFVRNISAEF